MEADILTWAYWAGEKSEVIRNLALAIAALLALPFLVWRTIAQSRISRAALEQSRSALKQADSSLAQSESSRKLAEAALEQAKTSSKQIDLAARSHFYEYLIKAFGQLSDDNPSSRLGAIYTLERLAAESEDHRYVVMRVLTEYLVSTSQLSHDEYLAAYGIDKEELAPKPSPIPEEEWKYLMPEATRHWPVADPDKDAILGILGGKVRRGLLGAHFLSFQGATLQGAKMIGLNFSSCSFTQANLCGIRAMAVNLEKANLGGAALIGANLRDANLRNSTLSAANLTGSILAGANLSQADLTGARLERVDLTGSNLEGTIVDHADFAGANLVDSKGFTSDQLRKVNIDSRTTLPAELVDVEGA